jgi:hypothetical protein
MKLPTRLTVIWRARQLARQLRGIERSIRSLPQRSRSRLNSLALREIGRASGDELPQEYGLAPDARELPWGQGTEASYERACSKNPEVAMRGIALWMAMAYHETRHSTDPRLQPQYRQLMQLLREIKQAQATPDAADHWMQSSQSSEAA